MAEDIAINVLVTEHGLDAVSLNMDKLESNSRKAQRALKFLSAEEKKGAISADQLEEATAQVNRELERMNRASLSAGKAAAGLNPKVRQLRSNVQNASYQFADFAVQIQGGQNAMVALGQQGSQLLGIFGAGGAIAGAALAIGTGIIGPMLAAKDATEETDEQVKALIDSYKAAVEVVKELRSASEQMQLGQEDVVFQAFTTWQDALDDVAKKQIDLADAQDLLADAVKGNASAWQNTHFGIKGLAKDVKAAKDATEEAKNQADSLRGNYEAAQKALQKFDRWKQVIKWEEEADKAAIKYGESLGIALGITQQIEGAMSGVVERTNEAAEAMIKAYQAGQAMEPEGNKRTLPLKIKNMSDEDYQDMLNRQGNYSSNRVGSIGTSGTFTPKKSKKSKSGSGDETTDQAIDKLMKELKLEGELLLMEDARAEAVTRLGEHASTASEAQIQALEDQIAANLKIEETLAKQEEIYDSIRDASGQFLKDLRDDTMSTEDAFKNMMYNVIDSIYEMLVLQPLIEGFMSILGGGSSGGSGLIGGLVNAVAGAAVAGISGASLSPGGVGTSGVSSATVGAAAKGNTYQNISIQGNGDSYLQKVARGVARGESITQISKAAPKIISASKTAVIAERRRGGTMKAAFG